MCKVRVPFPGRAAQAPHTQIKLHEFHIQYWSHRDQSYSHGVAEWQQNECFPWKLFANKKSSTLAWFGIYIYIYICICIRKQESWQRALQKERFGAISVSFDKDLDLPALLLRGGCGKVEVSLFCWVTVIGWEGMVLSCARGGSGWILGKNTSQKECWGTGTGCPGKWWSHHPWRCSITVEMWHWGAWFSGHGGDGLVVGLNNLCGLFQV